MVHADEAHRNTALKGISGQVCSIAYAIDDGPIEGHIRRPGESEGELLRWFFDSVITSFPDYKQQYPRLQWVGHNVIEFDLRFLKQRCWATNTQPSILIPADARHGEYVYDTMKAWTGWKGYVSQDALCKAFGIEGKQGMSGADVHDYYLAERYDEILDYNVSDVRIVREIYKRMMWK